MDGSIVIIKHEKQEVTDQIKTYLKQFAEKQNKDWHDINVLEIEQEEVNSFIYSLSKLFLPTSVQEKLVSTKWQFSNRKLPSATRSSDINFSQYELDER